MYLESWSLILEEVLYKGHIHSARYGCAHVPF